MLKSAPGAAPRSPELQRRLRWAVSVVVMAFIVLVARLWQLQIVRGDEYYEAARSNVVDKRFLPSLRGRILDRNGAALADNRPAFNVYGRTHAFGDGGTLLAELLGLSVEERSDLADRLRQLRRQPPGDLALLLADQGRDRAGLVAEARFRLPGVEIRHESHRQYARGKLAAHLLGYLSHPTPDELERLESEGYSADEFLGRYGLERQWENYLRGKKGVERFIKNAKGERVEGPDADGLIEGPRLVPPVAGHDVILTIDAGLQERSERAVRAAAAAAVAVVEVDSGRILALVSTPSFDPNVMTGHLTRAAEAELLADPRRPFIDKTLHQHYPPGSTFKLITAVAALNAGLANPAERMTCTGTHQQGGRTFRCQQTHGLIDMEQAFSGSCNVYFWRLAERVGLERIAETATDFGFGEPTGLDLNGDVAGRVPTRAWYTAHGGFTIGDTLNTATGQGDLEVTVLQTALAYAALANGGRLYAPQVVSRVQTAAGEVVADYPPYLKRRVALSTEHAALIRQGLRQVVNAPGGTAYAHAHSALVEFAGKTGTAQVRGGRSDEPETAEWNPRRTHAWFAGYAPADAPEIAIAVLIEHGGAGGKVAAPVAREIIEAYLATPAPDIGVGPPGAATAPRPDRPPRAAAEAP